MAEELAGLESVQQTMLALQADVHASEGGRKYGGISYDTYIGL